MRVGEEDRELVGVVLFDCTILQLFLFGHLHQERQFLALSAKKICDLQILERCPELYGIKAKSLRLFLLYSIGKER